MSHHIQIRLSTFFALKSGKEMIYQSEFLRYGGLLIIIIKMDVSESACVCVGVCCFLKFFSTNRVKKFDIFDICTECLMLCSGKPVFVFMNVFLIIQFCTQILAFFFTFRGYDLNPVLIFQPNILNFILLPAILNLFSGRAAKLSLVRQVDRNTLSYIIMYKTKVAMQ